MTDDLSRLARVTGALHEKLPNNKVRCFACGHRCLIADGQPGICRVRVNRNGVLYVPFGYVSSLNVDPVEKKPFFHVLPGSAALSFGMLGCDLHCDYCQNWEISQTLRNPAATSEIREIEIQELVQMAEKQSARLVVSTYNEPLITSEWAVSIFKEAKKRGLMTAYVSNGNGTPEVLEFLRPWLDCYKVYLKTFSDPHYRHLGGNLQKILDTITRLHVMKFWVEIVTLVVPGFNDTDDELRDITRFIKSLSPDIPWHVTAFHPDYKMQGPSRTPIETLHRAYDIARGEGLRYVYTGNLPGRLERGENTYCPNCDELLVERVGFDVLQNKLAGNEGSCPKCQAKIEGIWKQ